jgi:hypothetical protein
VVSSSFCAAIARDCSDDWYRSAGDGSAAISRITSATDSGDCPPEPSAAIRALFRLISSAYGSSWLTLSTCPPTLAKKQYVRSRFQNRDVHP